MIAKYLTDTALYECKKKVTSSPVPVVTCSSQPGNEKGRELVAAPGRGNFKLKFSFLAAGLWTEHQ